ncbi:MAG: hypothetical protein FWC34_05380, partial [Bacteroidetes bacterium]|nr:hypothetical protein [Bacteroidota bacterium]
MKSIRIKQTLILAILLLFGFSAFSQPTPAFPDRVDVRIINFTLKPSCSPTIPDSVSFDVQFRAGASYPNNFHLGSFDIAIDFYMEPGVNLDFDLYDGSYGAGAIRWTGAWGGIAGGPRTKTGYPPAPWGRYEAIQLSGSRPSVIPSPYTVEYQTIASITMPIKLSSTAAPTALSYVRVRKYAEMVGTAPIPPSPDMSSFWMGIGDISSSLLAFETHDLVTNFECLKPGINMPNITDKCVGETINLVDSAKMACPIGGVNFTFWRNYDPATPPYLTNQITGPYTVTVTETLFVRGSFETGLNVDMACDSIVSFTVVPKPGLLPPTINTPQEFCQYATVGDLNANGANVRWYASPTAPTPLPSTTSLVHGAIYYVAQVADDGCESPRSAMMVLIVPEDQLSAPVIADQTLCTDATVADILTDGSSGIVFFDALNNELSLSTPLANGTYKAIYRYGSGS